MDERTAKKILSFANVHKADAAEVFLRSYSSTTIEIKDQKVDAFELARDIGAGLRVIVQGRLGFAFTTDLSDHALDTLARAAFTNTQNTVSDPYHSIPEKKFRIIPS